MTDENLWLKATREYWRDPKNIIGPPGALVRRAIKLLWLVLSVYVLFWIAGPSQVASWQLWMENDQLAEHIAWGFTFAAALCFAVVGYVADVTRPVRVPLIIPKFEFGKRWNEGWSIKSLHLHVPNIRVALGSILAASLFLIALLGQWNYYLHDNLSTGGASVAAIEGSTSRVDEASAALRRHDESTAAALAIIDQGIRETSAGSPTGRSRLVAQRATLTRDAAAVRTQLAQDLRDARSETVTVRSTSTDPRPVDGQVASAVGADRGLVSSLLDLLRSGVIEALLVMGAGLGLVEAIRPAPPKVEDEAPVAEDLPPVETPPEAPPEPAPRRRFVLPAATEEDFAQALAVGPHPVTPPSGEAGGENAETEPSGAADDPVSHETPEAPPVVEDPLVAEQMENT